MAPTIVVELGKHCAYFEMCAGCLAVLLEKKPAAMEMVVDLHGGLINLANVLKDLALAQHLYRRVLSTLCSTQIFADSQSWIESHPDDTGVDAAYHYFVVSWMGRNGTAGCLRTNYQPSIRYTTGGGASATRWMSASESIPEWQRRLRRVSIVQGDMYKIIPQIEDKKGVAIYVDPTYLRETRAGGCKYLHELDEKKKGEDREDDHDRLADALGRFKKARVVVSYYDAPRLAVLYPDWTIRKCYRQKNLHVQNRRGVEKSTAPEVLLLNGPSYEVKTEVETQELLFQ